MTDNITPEDVQRLENVIDDADVPRYTRRWILGSAAMSAAALAAGGLAAPSAFAQSSGDDIKTLGTTAVTAEALAVTYLSNLIPKAAGAVPSSVAKILQAANASEQSHYEFLTGAGFKPLTRRFWIPDGAFDPKAAPLIIEYFEQIFVNAYLVGTTLFAAAGQADLARYAVEICGVEAEHRTLARSLQGKLPDNLAFESYGLKTIDAHVQAIAAAGVGLGTKGASPGAFYTYRRPPAGTVTALANTKPDQAA